MIADCILACAMARASKTEGMDAVGWSEGTGWARALSDVAVGGGGITGRGADLAGTTLSETGGKSVPSERTSLLAVEGCCGAGERGMLGSTGFDDRVDGT